MSQPEKGSGPTEFIFYILMVVLCFGGIWFILRPHIMWFSFFTSYYFFKYIYVHLSWLMTAGEFQSLNKAIQGIPHINPRNFGIGALWKLFEIHGYVLRWIVSAAMLFLAFKVKKNIVRFKYRREIKTVYDLIDIQSKHYVASAIVKGKDLLSKHLYDGPWQTYALPIDFALDNQLLWANRADNRTSWDPLRPVDEKLMLPVPPFSKDEKLKEFKWKRGRIPHYRYVAMHMERADELFKGQIGPLWSGSSNLPPLERALLAIFCAQAVGDIATANKLTDQIGFSWVEGTYDKHWKVLTPHHADTSGADDVLAKYESDDRIQDVIAKHAHVYNVIYGVLNLCRQNGRYYGSNFGWLRPVNRVLWIHLTSHGGQCTYWETAGIQAHYQMEENVGKRIVTPYVFGAVHAFYDIMQREHWIEPGEYGEEAQRREVEKANKLVQEATQQAQNQGQQGHSFAAAEKRVSRKDTKARADGADDY